MGTVPSVNTNDVMWLFAVFLNNVHNDAIVLVAIRRIKIKT